MGAQPFDVFGLNLVGEVGGLGGGEEWEFDADADVIGGVQACAAHVDLGEVGFAEEVECSGAVFSVAGFAEDGVAGAGDAFAEVADGDVFLGGPQAAWCFVAGAQAGVDEECLAAF